MGNIRKKKRPEWTCIAEREFDGDIVITDPCYVHDETKRINWEDHESWMKAHGLYNQTYYGDWGCTVFKANGPVGLSYSRKDSMGEFCADSGKVCVLDMRDAIKMAPDIDKWIEKHGWCATIIRGFKGTVRLMTLTRRLWRDVRMMSKEQKAVLGIKGNRMYYDDVELRVRGDGIKDGKPFCFESYQTGL